MTRHLIVILGDQLSHNISSLKDFDPNKDHILMCEVWDETQHVKHHKKKIAFIFSSMRHFAEELREKGFSVRYIPLDHPYNTGSFQGEIRRAFDDLKPEGIILTEPSEYRVLEGIKPIDLPIQIRNDDRFLCTQNDFSNWASGRKQLKMEYFYREMRKKYNILMEGKHPIGGKWNYDSENRRPPKEGLDIPAHYTQTPDKITQDVLYLVAEKFSDHFGDLEPFYFAVNRAQALIALEEFIQKRLRHFGTYQDAMIQKEPWMFHAHISFYINIGFLNPLECIKAVETAYHINNAPLNAVEGFIRQILGWREYVRGIYWLKMPEYPRSSCLRGCW